ncbi:BgTH12-06104 [Blumeria graminis f. sp. triticale]|uniref:BgtE-5624 n=3 Tax=Blumeria graminis TaxID=34373 RepID=A0A061HH24_BLUGR|nr:putative secreted effector protein [Blumeria graminis f. sp. tritici 96224]CAD6504373.1 BgTH12-06104 [Blumeria graminis f. sp. triticale]VDB91192.1 BgtE-5624 [Blumeria graminis f. sp. tritici]
MRYAVLGCLISSFAVNSLAGVAHSSDESPVVSDGNGIAASIGKRHVIVLPPTFNNTSPFNDTDSSKPPVSSPEPCGKVVEVCPEASKDAGSDSSKITHMKYRCDLAVFHQSQVEAAAKKGCEINKSKWKLLLSPLQLSPSKFHLLQDGIVASSRENEKLEGPFFIFPLMTSAETYTWGPRGEFRVLFNEKCQVAGVVHKKTSSKCEKNRCSVFKKLVTYERCATE